MGNRSGDKKSNKPLFIASKPMHPMPTRLQINFRERECCSSVDCVALFTLCLCAESKGSCWSVASAGSSGPRVHTPLNGGRGRGKRGHCCALARSMEEMASVLVKMASACVHPSAILEDKREKMEVNWGGNGIRAAPLIGACKINVLWTLQLHKIGTC